MSSKPKAFVLAEFGTYQSSRFRLIEDNSGNDTKLVLEEASGRDALGVEQWRLVCYSYPWQGSGSFWSSDISEDMVTVMLVKIRELTLQLEAVKKEEAAIIAGIERS